VFTVDRESQESLPEQVADALLRLINSDWRDRNQLPSVRQLASLSGVSPWTINEAYRSLIARGTVTARPGAGYFVNRSSARIPIPNLTREPRSVTRPVSSVSFVRNSFDPASHAVPAGSGCFPRSWMEDGIPASVVSKALRDPVMSVPAPVQGLLEFRLQIAMRLALSGIHAPVSQIVSTFGVTHATRLICHHVLKPGDRVVIEDPSYMVQQAQLRDMGAELLAVQRRADGPDLDQLEDIVRQGRPRLMITQSALQNPTGGTSSPANCYGLLSLAEKYDFKIIEDDTFGDLAGTHSLRLASLDGFRRVYYVGSFTKVLSPALRLGFIVCAQPDVEAIVDTKVLGVLTGSSLQELIVARTLKSGAYSAHIISLQRRLEKAQVASRKALGAAGVQFDTSSSDGLYLWGSLPKSFNMDELLRQAFDQGILLTKGAIFSPTGRFENYLRFNVAYGGEKSLLNLLRPGQASVATATRSMAGNPEDSNSSFRAPLAQLGETRLRTSGD
jgi:DNA-binding transcriptional MocR family regulator